MLNHRTSKKAFTLLELIVVIVILGLLAALAIPTFARVTKRSQDASTSATVASMLRDARALMAYQDASTTWKSAVVTAADETAAPAAAGFSAAALGLEEAATDPTTTAKGTFQVLGTTGAPTGVLLALRSKSDNICVGVATLTSASTPFCAPTADAAKLVAGATTVSGAVLSGGVAGAPLPSGVTAKPVLNAPSAPANLAVTATTATSVSASWSASVATNSAVTGYTLTATPVGGGTAVLKSDVAASATSATLPGLVSSTQYALTITAQSSAGDSTKGGPVAFTTPVLVVTNFLAADNKGYFTSADATTWSARKSVPGMTGSVYGTTFDNGEWYVMGDGSYYKSADLDTWTKVIVSGAQTITDLEVSDDGKTVVVVSPSLGVKTSLDGGATWKAATGVTAGSSTAVVGVNTNVVYFKGAFYSSTPNEWWSSRKSSDGVTWASWDPTSNLGVFGLSTSTDGSRLMASGNRGVVLMSTDGTNWTSKTGASWVGDQPSSVRYLGDRISVLGGVSTGTGNAVCSFAPATSTTCASDSASGVMKAGASVTAVRGNMVLAGARMDSYSPWSVVYVMSAANSWRAVTLATDPGNLFGLVGVAARP
jgi:prepilin-type N-terminal cleavage/methylation domain-containing protein